jgi:hypothetical protein
MVAWISPFRCRPVNLSEDMPKIVLNLFSREAYPARLPRPDDLSLNAIRDFAERGFNPFRGYYTPDQSGDIYRRRGTEMHEDVMWIAAQADIQQSASLFALTAKNMRLYCHNYRQQRYGDDKTPYLRQGVEFIERALMLDPENATYRLMLVGWLVGFPQIRDYDRARSLISLLPPSAELDVMLETMHRIEGDVGALKMKPLASFKLFPLGDFDMARKSARAVLRAMKKSGDIEQMKPWGSYLYSVAVLYEIAWHLSRLELNRPAEYQRQLANIPTVLHALDALDFPTHGRLIDSRFLSTLDYKNLELVHGATTVIFDPRSLLAE